MAWFNVQGVECLQVMSDNSLAYITRGFGKAYKSFGLRRIRTYPYTPLIIGRAERFI